MTSHARIVAGALVLTGALATATHAQSTQPASDTHWRAWIGCWEPVPQPGAMAADAAGLRVCVVPAGTSSAVDIVNVANGKETGRTRIEASGEQHTIGREGCTGVEQAQWAPNNARVYLRGTITCDGVQRTTSGLLAFAPNGQWIDVQGVTTGRNSGVHVTRYQPLESLAGVPADIIGALPVAPLAQSTARSAAAAPLVTDDVLDATRHADEPVVEAWLVERGQGFDLDAKRLVALADAGVPGQITDVMVALTYPKTFAVNPSARQGELTRDGDTRVAGRTIPVTTTECYGMSPFGYGAYGAFYSPYAYDSCAYRYGISPYGYGYGNYGYGYGYSGPVVIVRPSAGNSDGTTTRPRAVAGHGYTEGRSAPPSTNSGSSTSRGSSGSTGSSTAGSSAGSSSSGSSSSGGERTAKPRVPR